MTVDCAAADLEYNDKSKSAETRVPVVEVELVRSDRIV